MLNNYVFLKQYIKYIFLFYDTPKADAKNYIFMAGVKQHSLKIVLKLISLSSAMRTVHVQRWVMYECMDLVQGEFTQDFNLFYTSLILLLGPILHYSWYVISSMYILTH